MRFEFGYFLGISLALVSAGPVRAQVNAAEACTSSGAQQLCPATCGGFCSDAEFLRDNVSYCAVAGFSSGGATDSAECTTLFGAADAVGGDEDPDPAPSQHEVVETATPTEDCSRFERQSERRRCELQLEGGRPTCSANVPDLERSAALLASEVQAQLASYGDLLTRDLSDVSSRELLCSISLEELDKNYERATSEPEGLRVIQRNAADVQTCQGEWQEYVRNRQAAGVSDALQDDTARSLQEQLAPLEEQLVELSSSITKLNQAAQTIDGLIVIHFDFCDPEGTPLSGEN